MYKRKTWSEKLYTAREPEVEKLTKDFAGARAGERMLIPTPKLIDDYIRHIPKGKEVEVEIIRKDLAAEYNADITCPLTTGIFLRISAEAAYEEYEKGTPVSKITPFWRVINDRMPTAKKLSFGTDFVNEQRRKEKLN